MYLGYIINATELPKSTNVVMSCLSISYTLDSRVQVKGKVSIARSHFCDVMSYGSCFCSLEPAVSKYSVYWTVDHTFFITCRAVTFPAEAGLVIC